MLILAKLDNEIRSAMPGDTSLTGKWRRFLTERGERLSLFVRSEFEYDPSTGRFSLEGNEEESCYIEQVSSSKTVMRIKLDKPVSQTDIYGYRNIYQERLSPDLSQYYPYKVFESNEEAIAYVEKVISE